MGMSSSQARLLTLTARQHDVEWRAQKLQADKLQMANDSDRVYNQYLAALGATKIQAQVSDLFNGESFVDATLKMLENGDAKKTLFLQDISTGNLLLSRDYANAHGLSDSKQYNSFEDYLLDIEGISKPNSTHKGLPYTPGAGSTDLYTEITAPTFEKVTDYTRIATINGVANGVPTPITVDTTYKPVENTNPSIDYDTFINENFEKISPLDLNNYKSISSLDSSVTTLSEGSYVVSSSDELNRLKNITIGSNVTIILGNDIDVDNWTGINNFNGTFNGNGKTITINGTSGLFTSINSNATVKNVKIIADIENTSASALGGISNGSNLGTIENCVVTGTIKGKAHVGGICGENGDDSGHTGTINNCSADITITASGTCVGGLSGHNSGNITNSRVTGEITNSSNWTGGICGHNTGTTTIENCCTEVELLSKTGGSILGQEGSAEKLTINNVIYRPELNPSLTMTNKGDFGTGNFYRKNVEVPSKDAFANEIMAVFIKSGKYDVLRDDNKDEITTKIDNFLNNYFDASGELISVDSGKSMSMLNIFLNEYLSEENVSSDNYKKFAEDLYNTIVNADTSTTEVPDYLSYTDKEIDTLKGEKVNAASFNEIYVNKDTDIDNIYKIGIKPSKLIIPSEGDIKTILAAVCQKYDENSLTQTENISAKVNAFYSKIAADQLTLVKVNEVLNDYISNNYSANRTDSYYSDFISIMDSIKNGSSLNLSSSKLINDLNQEYKGINIDKENYKTYITIKHDTTNHDNLVIYPEKEELNGYDCSYDWNYDNPTIKAAYQGYLLSKIGYTIIGDDVQSTDYDGKTMDESSTWLTNVINCGVAQFVDMDDIMSIVEDVKKISSATNIEDRDKEAAMNKIISEKIKNTSVANEVCLQEVADTEAVKKAEATYEAQMRKINRKETRIDNELSELETERNAIKTEQEDLKTVIKNNVDMSFKLFS